MFTLALVWISWIITGATGPRGLESPTATGSLISSLNCALNIMEDGISFAIGGAALTALCGLVGSWIKARYGKTQIEPQPLAVETAPRYVTCEECQRRHQALDKRIDDFRTFFDRIDGKLDRIERNSEDRAKRLHSRLDPLVETAHSNAELIQAHLQDHRSGRI